MEKNVGALIATLSVLFLLVGGLVGFNMAGDNVVEVTKEIPVEVLVNNTVEVPVEVANADLFLDESVDELLKYLEDEDKLKCSGDEYDLDEVEVSKVYDEFSVEFDDDEYTVTGEVKLSFKQAEEKRCRKNFDFEVFFEDGEDPVVSLV